MNWRYTDEQRSAVYRVNEDGSMESCIADREDVVEWVAQGNVIEEPDPNDTILSQILALEALQTPRLIREAMHKKQDVIADTSSPLFGMTPEGALDYIDAQVSALRGQLTAPYNMLYQGE